MEPQPRKGEVQVEPEIHPARATPARQGVAAFQTQTKHSTAMPTSATQPTKESELRILIIRAASPKPRPQPMTMRELQLAAECCELTAFVVSQDRIIADLRTANRQLTRALHLANNR